jgi:hypothetical protein
LLEKAWQLGCRFDGWSEHFSYKRWQQAFKELGINPEAYANRSYGYADPLPWDHLNCGMEKEALVQEHRLAFSETVGQGSEG